MFEPLLRRLAPFAREFTQRGRQIHLVGGAVRNLLLGRPVKDFDFATDAKPEEVQGYFRKVLPTGLQHGTVTVLFQGDSYEVTTFRVDGDYTDGRRPDQVTFTPRLEEDLRRRDFTVNAIALDLATGELSDPHGGRQDLERKLLRAIGDPGQRFDEDALRILRLYRFAAQLGFDMDPSTEAAVIPRVGKLSAVSPERIHDELVKTLEAPTPSRAWKSLHQARLLPMLFSPLPIQELTPLGLEQLDRLPAELRWCFWLTLCAGSTPTQWEGVLRRLKFSNQELDLALGPARMWPLESGVSLTTQAKSTIEAWGNRGRSPSGLRYLEAVIAAGFWSDTGLLAELRRVVDSQEPVFLKEMPWGGQDVMAAGVPPGPKVGQALRCLQRKLWEAPEANKDEVFKELVQAFL